MNSTISTMRADLRTAEDEYTRASALVDDATDFAEKRRRGAGADPDPLVEAMGSYLNPGPGAGTSGVVQPAQRRSQLGFLTDAHVEHGNGKSDFFTVARATVPEGGETVDGETVRTLLTDLEEFVGGSTDADAVVSTLETLASGGNARTVAMIAEVTKLLAHAARGWRDALVSDLNNDFPEGERDAETLGGSETGEVQKFLDSAREPVDDLQDEAIALLPIRLETRFVGTDRDGVDSPQLWVRIYPDTIHNDSHESQLTDREARLGRTYWAYLWLGTHRSIDGLDRSYFEATLPEDADRLVELLVAVEAGSFPTDPVERKDAIKERAWKQLLESLGRERAAYVVHETKPSQWTVLSDEETVLDPVPDGDRGSERSSGGGTEGSDTSGASDTGTTNDTSAANTENRTATMQPLSLPTPARRPASWTRPPVARLLPDRWIAYGVWSHDEADHTEVFIVKSNAVREPLPVGPDPESLAVAEQYGEGDPAAAEPSEVGDVGWITDFGQAERYGMAMRITETDVFTGADSGGPVSEDAIKRSTNDLTDGTVEQLVVTGVKASMDPGETASRLRGLFDAHHYMEGVELVRQGTPTNNADVSSGYRSVDDPVESMAVECSTPLLEHGDYSDGDQLARALGIDPAATGGEHVFAHVENADNTDQLDAWMANSALWPATMGYYYQNMLYPMASGAKASLRYKPGNPTDPWIDEGQGYRQWHAERMGWFDAYRRHFLQYVRAQGPLPAFRTGTQPYGVLPVTPMADDRESIVAPDTDEEHGSTRLGGQRIGIGGGTVGGGGTLGGGSTIGSAFGGEGGSDGSGMTGGGEDPDAGGWTFQPWDAGEESGADSIDATTAWENSSRETFRRTVAPSEARGAITDEEVAATYDPEEAARTFTTAELAEHYEAAEAARVLSSDQLRKHYGEEELAAADVDPDAVDGTGSER
jgi:hypothetical protein